MPGPAIPTATYRLQLSPAFGFDRAREAAGYVAALGVSDVYLSPVLAAGRGSEHGYDVADPTRLNPALGGAEGFEAMAERLRRRGLGLLLDVVPNHMAAGPDNPWWTDVLAHGPSSRYARHFDIDWEAPGLEGRVLL
ncbi:MAG: alpha-amylase family glycosyl hydrolase, partial [Actinomycetota bacterium]|nr:alpha-amylase family glycosyl hydrolase [Actinomycetota bacterium]